MRISDWSSDVCSSDLPEAARHDRVALEMTFEEPEVRLDVEFGHDLAFAVFPALVGDPGDAVHHQHRRQGKLGIARAEQPSVPALDQLVVAVAVLPLERQNGLSPGHFPITTGNHSLTARDNTTNSRRTGKNRKSGGEGK